METKITRKIKLRIGFICRTSADIVEYHFNDDVLLETKDINEMMDAHTDLLNDNERLPVLVLPGVRNDVGKEARSIDVAEYRKKNTTKEAIVVTNLPTRLAVYFYYQFNKPPYPFKVFRKIEDARKWLKE